MFQKLGLLIYEILSTEKVEVKLKERIEILRRENSFEQGSKIKKGVKGFDLGMRVVVACRGRRVGRVKNPCKIQTLTQIEWQHSV